MLLKTPVMTLFMAQVRDSLTPAGTQSILSVRSMSIVPAAGSMLTLTLIGIPSGSGPNGSWRPCPMIVPFGIWEMTWATRRSE